MPRIQKRISSSKKKKKNKDKMKSSSSSSKRKPMNITTTDFNEILSQADIAYETSNVESALQLYSYAQLVLQQTLQKQEKEQPQSGLSRAGSSHWPTHVRDSFRSKFRK